MLYKEIFIRFFELVVLSCNFLKLDKKFNVFQKLTCYAVRIFYIFNSENVLQFYVP